MPDVLTPAQRSYNMSRVRGRNTKPEVLLRRGLHQKGLRFRLHAAELPGKPDLVFPRYRAVILVHGCFWHGHDCPLFSLPSTRQEFWCSKIAGNRERDCKATKSLISDGWRVMTVWECSLRGAGRLPFDQVLSTCVAFVRSTCETAELRGGPVRPPKAQQNCTLSA